RIVLLSQITTLPSSTVGTRPLGLRARYSGSRLRPNCRPASIRSKGIFISAHAHITFWTFDDVFRPQILSMACLLLCLELRAHHVNANRRGREAATSEGDGPKY